MLKWVLVLASFSPLARAQSGGLDYSFGTGGIAVTSLSSASDKSRGMLQLKDGRLVAVGEASVGGQRDFAVARYLHNGQLDHTFNGTGFVTTPIGSADDYAYAAVEQSDRKIVAAGWALGAQNQIALVRYGTNGSLDPSFGTGGIVRTGMTDWSLGAYAVTLDKKGRILVAAQGVQFTPTSADYHYVTLRYLSNGELDASFGNLGMAILPLRNGFPHAVVALKNGKIIVGGHHQPGADYNLTLVQYQHNGTLDSSFGTGGTVILNQPNSIARQILTTRGGTFFTVGGWKVGTQNQVLLARFHANGALDASFGTGGLATAPLSGDDDPAYQGIRVGKNLVIAGQAKVNGENRFAFASFRKRTGAVDMSFGTAGVSSYSVGNGGEAGARGIIYDSCHHRLVAAGGAKSDTAVDFALVAVKP